MNISIKSLCAILVASFFCVGCGDKEPEVEVFTLYRNVPSDQAFRVHAATFDASGPNGKGSEFGNWSNMKNCERTQQMFQAQPDWKDVRFCCEKGRFKK
jgi:predicted Fe-S protein YdhL (DUF1289 family)